MTYKYFLHNGQIKPAEEAVIPVTNVEYSYGYGVYETLRFSKGTLHFAPQHIDRLFSSASIIGLEHTLDKSEVLKNLDELTSKNEVEACNIKILLLGGKDAQSANIYMFCTNPLFPDRKLYKTGVKCILEKYERMWPGAKTLNMLPSYMAYKKARSVDAYEALLENNKGYITEGTRTNFFVIKGKTITSPPAEDILPGVTRANVLKQAKDNGYELVEDNIKFSDLTEYDGAFITSTSTKIMPIKSIDDFEFPELPEELKELINLFNDFLETNRS